MLSYETGIAIKDMYDPRTLIRNIPEVVTMPYCYHRNGTASKSESSVGDTHRGLPSHAMAKQIPNCGIAAKLGPNVVDGSLFYMTHGGSTKLERVYDRAIINRNLMHAKAQSGGLVVPATNAALHRKVVATLQHSMSNMY